MLREVVETIWDGGGRDRIDASSQTVDASIDLRPGAFSSIGSRADGSAAASNLAIAYGAVIEDATGGSGDDRIIGNDADNRLDGGLGADTLTGGAGNDLFLFDPADGGDTDLIRIEGVDYLDGMLASGSGSFGAGNGIQVGATSGGRASLYFNIDGVADAADRTLLLQGAFTIGDFILSDSALLRTSSSPPGGGGGGGGGSGDGGGTSVTLAAIQPEQVAEAFFAA